MGAEQKPATQEMGLTDLMALDGIIWKLTPKWGRALAPQGVTGKIRSGWKGKGGGKGVKGTSERKEQSEVGCLNMSRNGAGVTISKGINSDSIVDKIVHKGMLMMYMAML